MRTLDSVSKSNLRRNYSSLISSNGNPSDELDVDNHCSMSNKKLKLSNGYDFFKYFNDPYFERLKQNLNRVA